MSKNRITIDGNSLKIEELYNIVNNNYEVSFPEDKAFIERLKKSRKFLEDYIAKGYPVYGVTTGFGDSCDNQIHSERSHLLQKYLVAYHGIGMGDYFSEKEGRAVVLARLNSNIKGYSAIRAELAEIMLSFLNKGISPAIPKLGSVGASGDLTPLGYLAAAIMGERNVYYKGELTTTSEAFKKENITPLPLQAKEGLAIMNGTSVMTALISLAWMDIKRLANISDFITGATVEVLEGNDLPYREKVSAIKNHIGQIDSANYITSVIKDSKRARKYEDLLKDIGTIDEDLYKKHDVKIQDRYSLRCAPHVNGALRDTLIFTKTWIENELNSSNDNPLIDEENNIIYNSGNFYGGHITLAADYLRVAVANISDLAEKQAELIIDGKFNNLTSNLIPFIDEPSKMGIFHGFKAAQITMTALASEANFLSAPVSIHSRPTESLNQDKVSLGTISARKLREQVELIYNQYSVHIMALTQAMDLIGIDKFGSFSKKVYKEIRNISKFVDEDRALDTDAKKVADFLKSTEIFA